jgi:hypothetical protein
MEGAMAGYGASRCLSSFAAGAAVLALAASAQASVEISADPTKNMSCVSGVCTPTAKNADLNATDLANMLATSDVKVLTGSGAVTITVESSFSWTSTHRLSLDAMLNVSFRVPVTVAGQGGLTIVTNDGGSGGDLLFFPGGKIDFWDPGSSLIVNGNSYTLVDDIATLEADVAGGPSGFYALAKDYDAGPDGTYVRAPVYSEVDGTVEGLGHAISNLTINVTRKSWNAVGLFATISDSGTLRDINIVNANAQAVLDNADIGTLLGSGKGAIIQCSATGVVQGGDLDSISGGLAGSAGTITRSNADVTVNGGGGDAGGLVAVAFSVSDSYATGDVTSSNAGGLAATNDGTIVRSHATGHVVGRDFSGGGLVASNSGQISQSYATGAVSGGESAGGLVAGSGGGVTNSYSTGSVQGGKFADVGGLVAQTASTTTLSYSYSTGDVHGPRQKRGGLVGDVADGTTLKDDYWDVTTSGEASGWGKCKGEKRHCEKEITGLTDTELKSSLPSGFDASIWGQDSSVNSGYPYLLANPPQ